MSRRMLPTVGLSGKGIECVASCLKADGTLLSILMYEWVYRADEQRRDEIDRQVRMAVASTIHLWA